MHCDHAVQRLRSSTFALGSAALALLAAACGLGPAAPEVASVPAACAVAHEKAPWSLTLRNVSTLGLEAAPNPVKIASGCEAAMRDPEADAQHLSPETLARLRDDDRTWLAADGSRYEAMLILGDGTAFGRKGAAPRAPNSPGDANRFGAWEGTLPSDAAVQDAIERLERGQGDGTLDTFNPFADERRLSRGILGDALSDDRRIRLSSTPTLTSYPFRTIGALNSTSAAGFTSCTGTKVGPRHVITAAHCVLSSAGTWTTSGWFHPGQTNSTHLNTSGTAISWSGVYARDWRISRGFDYALLYLEDRADSTNLGWMGIAWWNQASSYLGVTTSLYGYPAKTGSSDVRKCKASTLANDDCDGWMYGHSAVLDGNAFRSDAQLEYNIDTGPAQSGSAVWRNNAVLGVHWGCAAFGGCDGDNRNRAARVRQSMWDDVCGWIGQVDSAFGAHSLCP